MSSRSFHRRVARRLNSNGRREIGIRNSSEGVCYTPSQTVVEGCCIYHRPPAINTRPGLRWGLKNEHENHREKWTYEYDGCCCCCSYINSHNQVRGHRTGSSHSGAEEYPREKHTQPKVVHAYITAHAIHASTRNI